MVIIGHLGLGDHIIMAGAIAKIAGSTNEKVTIPCFQKNIENVKTFYVNVPNVECIETDGELSNINMSKVAYSSGYYNPLQQNSDESFMEWFYRQMGMEYDERFINCPIFSASKHFEQVGPEAIFVHDKPEHPINKKGLRPSMDKLLLSHANAIFAAKEVHCIDSSFHMLIESLPTSGELFFHRSSWTDRLGYKHTHSKKWEII